MRHAYIRPTGGLAVLVASLFAVVLLAQQSPRELFERARLLEDSNQDLTDAISLYGQVVEQASGQRALAATAQLRLGLLYERLGRHAEAQRAFTAVVNEYADQRAAAQQAQARLAAADSNAQEAGVVARRVWDGPEVDLLGAVSPDGQLLTYVDWITGNLAIRNLTTGESRRLTDKETAWDSLEYALLSIFSPDGKRVAYDWQNDARSWDLRIIGVDGSEPRVLYRNPGRDTVDPKAWSPDGTQILALSGREDRTGQIVLVSVADGSVRVVKSLDWRWRGVGGMSLSPDGRSIVYGFPPLEDAPERDLFLLATDGSREIPLVEHPADDHIPVWTPDGKRVLFTSDRTGEPALWAVDVADGAATGSARLVGREVGRPLGFTSSGAYYFGRGTQQRNIYMAALDPATGRLSGSPTKLAQRVEHLSYLPNWSPDGRSLAYHTGSVFESGVVVVRSRDTGAERTFRHDVARVRAMRWFPDGRSLLLAGVDQRFRPGIYRLDIESGATTLLFREENVGFVTSSWPAAPVVSPDGTTIFHTRHHSESSWAPERLLAYDLTTGEDREVYHPEARVLINRLALSPDGRQVAFSTAERTPEGATSSASLHVMPVGGGEVRHVLTMPGNPVYVAPIAWTPDGRGLFFEKPLPGRGRLGQNTELWRLSLDGGEPARIDLHVEGNVADLSVHPDGRQLAFSVGETRQEVWVLENLLAELEGQD